MLKMKDMNSVSDYLMKSDYSSRLEETGTQPPRAANLAKVFHSVLVSRCFRLVELAPGRSKRFLEAYLQRLLVEDMKRIVRAKHAKKDVDTNSLIAIPKGHASVDLQRMSEASTLQEAVESLGNTRFRQVADVLPIYQKYGLVSLVEASINKVYFDSEVRPSLRGVPSQACVKDMVATETDLVNIGTLTDLRVRGIDPEATHGISFAPVRLKASEVKLISRASADSIPEVVAKTRYADLAQPIRDALGTEKEESLEHVIRLEVYRRSKSLMVRYADTLAYVLGYVREAEAEANNLVSVVTGKELGLADTKIASALCM
jgi:vacuolar-type H+-ATPase subunit C/Vma6